MSKSRIETWIAAVLIAVGLVPIGLLGLWGYISATATPLHPTSAEVPSVPAGTPAPLWAEAVDRSRQLVRTALVEQNLPGVSVAIGTAGRVVWAEGFGWADLDTRVPVSPDTRFRIGTASVALTSAAAGLLLEGERLRLNAPIQAYVPEFPEKDRPVLLRDLMGHVAGIRNDGGDEGPLFSVRCDRPADALPHFADRPLLFEPGTEYRYSSYGWILVSAAVEAAAAEPFLAFMQREVFDRLGMNDTVPDSAGAPVDNQATAYFPRFAADPKYGLHAMRPLDYSCYAGASAFVSTPSDLVRFGLAMSDGSFLQPSTVQILQTSLRLATEQETGYGLGWDLETVTIAGRQTPVVGHEGEVLGGEVASLLILPEHGMVIAVTSNLPYADTSAIAAGVAEVFAGARTDAESR